MLLQFILTFVALLCSASSIVASSTAANLKKCRLDKVKPIAHRQAAASSADALHPRDLWQEEWSRLEDELVQLEKEMERPREAQQQHHCASSSVSIVISSSIGSSHPTIAVAAASSAPTSVNSAVIVQQSSSVAVTKPKAKIASAASISSSSTSTIIATSTLSKASATLSSTSKLSTSSSAIASLSSSSSSISSTSTAPLSIKTSTAWSGDSQLALAGLSGVGAMQLVVVDDDHIAIFDKVENNAMQVNGHAAWGSVYEISTQSVRPLNLKTNSFCASGSFLSNGTLVSLGGNEMIAGYDGNGQQSIRLFNSCTDSQCDIYEDPPNLHLTSNRWYPSTARLDDGSIFIIGGATAGAFTDAPERNNPTIEFFPGKGNKMAIHSQFLVDSLNTNLFPVTFLLPSGEIFVAANLMAMVYNWRTNTERRLPGFPNGVRINYPASAASVLLPLTIANNFTAEVLICGGSSANVEGDPTLLSSQTPASKQCVRMVMNEAGYAGGWIVEQMPEARVMGDAILTPDSKVLIVNGAHSGVAGYGNVANQVGQSNADNPAYRATLYDPLALAGSRFSTNFPSSTIERLYHSTASLLPTGDIIIAGSNPNPGVSTTRYATRYEVEILSPPYTSQPRPSYSQLPSNILYNSLYNISVVLPAGTQVVTAVIMDLGFSTHGVHMNQRLVELYTSRSGNTVGIKGPSTPGLFPPGYAWLYILADGVPSKGKRVMIGTGFSPV